MPILSSINFVLSVLVLRINHPILKPEQNPDGTAIHCGRMGIIDSRETNRLF